VLLLLGLMVLLLGLLLGLLLLLLLGLLLQQLKTHQLLLLQLTQKSLLLQLRLT
jgi:hypothetical protein